jgi:hypothetical protein
MAVAKISNTFYRLSILYRDRIMSNTILTIINIINSSGLRMYQLSAVYMVVWVLEVVTVILRFCWKGRKSSK